MTLSSLRLDPRNDVVFKLLFARDEELLVALLTAVLRPRVPIQRAVVQNPELPKDFHDDKGSILDVFVVLDDGTHIDVEMQRSKRSAWRERCLYYWANVFSSQLVAGQKYEHLGRVVSILFLDYQGLPLTPFHEIFCLRGDRSGADFSPLLEIHTIELPQLQAVTSFSEEDEALVRWGRFLSSTDPEVLDAMTQEDPMIRKAEEALARLSADPTARFHALERERQEVAYRITMGGARREGLEEGRLEGQIEERRAILRRFLHARFGELPSELEQKIAEGDAGLLQEWLDRVLDAPTLDDVFSPR